MLFGSQFRGRGPGSRFAPGVQRRAPFGGNGPPTFDSGRFGLRDDVTFLGDWQPRRQGQRQTQLSSQRSDTMAISNQRFQGFGSQSMMLREALQPLHAAGRIRTFRSRTRSWRQPNARSRGRIPANPEVVRQGFIQRFTGQRQSADTSRRQPQVISNRQAHVVSRVSLSGRHSVETPRQLAVRENPNIRKTFVTSQGFHTGPSQPRRITTDQRSSLNGQSSQVVSQSARPAVTHSKPTFVSPVLASNSHTVGSPVNHAVPQSAPHQFVKPQVQHVASHVSHAGKTQPTQNILSSAHATGTVVSSLPVAQPKAVVSPIVINPKPAPVASQAVQSTEVTGEATLEDDLALINAIVALLQAAGSNLQLTVPAAAPVQSVGHAPQAIGTGQFGRAMYPGMISPWMGAPLGSVHYQELMFGDTTDPADILATTTAAPNITVGNMSEPILNASIVTAAVKVAAPEQIPAPQGEGITPVSVSEVPVSTAPTEVVKLKSENSIKTEIKIDAKIREEVPTLKLEPLPETVVHIKPAKETVKHENKQKLAGVEALKAKGLDLVKIVSDALTAASYPTKLRKALIKELSNVLGPNSGKNPITEVVADTNSGDIVVADVASATTMSPDFVSTTAKIEKTNTYTTPLPLETDIVTDRLPTAADLGIVLKNIPIEATTKSPTKVEIKEPTVVVLNPEIVSTVRKVVEDIVANKKKALNSIVKNKNYGNFVSKYEAGPHMADKTIVVVKDVTIENSVKEVPLNADGAKIELAASGLVKESNNKESLTYPKVEIKTANMAEESKVKELITQPIVLLKPSDATKESKVAEVIAHPKVLLKPSDATKESKVAEVIAHPKVLLKPSDVTKESKVAEVIAHPKVLLKPSDATKESKVAEVIAHPKVLLKPSDATKESKVAEVIAHPKILLKPSDATKESKVAEVIVQPKIELKTSDAMNEPKMKEMIALTTSDVVKDITVKEIVPLLNVEVKPLDTVQESKVKDVIGNPELDLNPINIVSESKAKEVAAVAKVELKLSDVAKENMPKEVVVYPKVETKPLDLIKESQVNEVAATPTVDLNPSETVKESMASAVVTYPAIESKQADTKKESKVVDKVVGLPIALLEGDNSNTIGSAKPVSKPAFEIVLESLVTQSGGGVEFLSRPVHSVDPAIVNQLTAVPKLASVENKAFTRQPIFPETIKAESIVKNTSTTESIVPAKAVETNADKTSADKAVNVSANIPKDSILQQIDLLSLAKELSLISNGTDITQYLSDPLFVKVLEDIVTQTLSAEANKQGKKTKPKNKPTTTVKPKVSTEEIEIELEDIVTTTSMPSSTSVDIIIESTTTPTV